MSLFDNNFCTKQLVLFQDVLCLPDWLSDEWCSINSSAKVDYDIKRISNTETISGMAQSNFSGD
jgi:hypothetical protein